MIHATQKAASENGLDILLLDSDLNVIREAELIQRIRSQVDGIIMASPMGPGGKLQAALRQTPAILVNRISKRFPCVLFDHTEALRQAGATLKSFGHDRIALLRGPQTSWVVAQRAGAVLQWAKNARVEIIDLGNYAASYAGGLDAAAALAHKGATAAFAFDDLMACGVLAGLKKQGVSVPTSFSLVGCDDVLLSSIVTPSLTTIRGPMTDLSNMAVTSLLRLIGNEVSPEYRVTIPGQLVMRESVAVPGTIHEYLLP
jgi:DNA-binding LacI/PurR family transcriptional regulator